MTCQKPPHQHDVTNLNKRRLAIEIQGANNPQISVSPNLFILRIFLFFRLQTLLLSETKLLLDAYFMVIISSNS